MANYRNDSSGAEWPLASLAAVGKALGDPGRLRILVALGGEELCVCQLVELLRLAPSTVSKHLFLLKAAGLVATRKEGRWIHCRAADSSAPAPVRRAIRWAIEAGRNIPEIRADRAKMAKIRRIDKEALCRRRTRK
ncbi:MAG: metalloregulator ArsR/SmtB family transcription factor [Candidatus Hydrogenedentota bacterium]